MKKVESIWAELSAKAQEVAQESTELSEEVKVELAASAELNKYVGQVETAIKQMRDNFKKLNNIVSDIKSQESELDRQINTAENNYKAGDLIKKKAAQILAEIETQAKELGVKTSQVDNYEKLETLAREAVGVSENLYFLQNDAKGLRGALRKVN